MTPKKKVASLGQITYYITFRYDNWKYIIKVTWVYKNKIYRLKRRKK